VRERVGRGAMWWLVIAIRGELNLLYIAKILHGQARVQGIRMVELTTDLYA
jgi:hypothetical protein